MARSNIDTQKFLKNKFDASTGATEEKLYDSPSLNMLEEGVYADITFQARGGTVKAHRGVLATASPVFREMFLQHEMKVQQTPSTVTLHDIDMTLDTLQLFLVLIYISDNERGAVPELNAAVDTHFIALFDAAHKFKVERRLNSVLTCGLLRHLTPANCWDFYHRCKGSTSPPELQHDFSETCLSYVMNNFEEVMASDTIILEMQRDPKLVHRCIIGGMSTTGMW